MKQLIRKMTFETNSSSMHSLVISKNDEYFTEEEIKKSFYRYQQSHKASDNIIIDFDTSSEFWNNILNFERTPFDILYTYCDKLRYYLASRHYIWTDEDYKNYLEEVKTLHPFIKDFIFPINSYKDIGDENQFDYGYVDHQSNHLLGDFLIKRNITPEEFLKNKQYIIIIDGDEYRVTDRLVESNLMDIKELIEPW